jgi:hypothetical protein
VALPSDADIVAVRGYWWDEITGQGVKGANGQPAVITFDPVQILGVSGSGTPNVRDAPSTGHIKTRRRQAVVDPVTGYFCTLLLSNNDPDLDAYGGRKVSFPGERPFLIEVPYNAPFVQVDAAMSAAIGRPVGSQVRAIWLTDASLLENPAPGAPSGYMTAEQTLAAISNGIAASIKSHHHEQISPLALWSIPHGLGFNPGGIVARDVGGSLIEPEDITYPDLDTCVLSWVTPVAGSADLS